MLRLVLVGQLPSGKNQVQLCARGGRIHKYPNARFSAWREEALLQLRVRQGSPLTSGMPVSLTVEYTPGDRRVRDVSGMLDALFHLLVRAEILDDDGLVWEVHWIRHPAQPRAAGAILTLTERTAREPR